MSRQGLDCGERVKCGSRVQWQYMKKHNKNMHQGGRRRIHVCPYCSADEPKTYSTFLDWRNHLSETHPTCIQDGNPLLRAEYATGFKLDGWGRLHELDGRDTDSAYQHIVRSRERCSRYQAQVEGQPPGSRPRSNFHTSRAVRLTRIIPQQSRSWRGACAKESKEALEEGEVQVDYTGIRSGETDTESENTNPGRDSWRNAHLREAAVPSTPRSSRRGKRRADRGRGSTKKPWLESLSSEQREESEGSTSRSGSTQGQPSRGGQRADRPRTPHVSSTTGCQPP